MAANNELVPVAELLRLLVSLSEKAASLARLVRRDKGLFELLVEEKTEESKNKRFQVDFKTLGDVLIQETVKYFIGKKVNQLFQHQTPYSLTYFTCSTQNCKRTCLAKNQTR